MDSSSVSSFKRALWKIETVLNSAWTTVLTYVGATEDASLWWRAVFERKILKGEVGLSFRWYKSRKTNILWEMESLVKSLSRENQWSADNLKKGNKSPTKPRTFSQTSTDQDSSLNNSWIIDKSRNVNLNSRKSKDLIEQDERKGWYSKHTNRDSKEYWHAEQTHTCCDLNQSSADNAENNVCEVKTFTFSTKGTNEYQEPVTRVEKSRFGLSSRDDIRPQRCASWPDMLCSKRNLSMFRRDISSCSLTHATSLSSLYSQVNVFENANSLKQRKGKNSSKCIAYNTHFVWEKDLVDTSHCSREQMNNHVTAEDFNQINQIDWNLHRDIDLDELLLHKDDLDMLWEEDLPPEEDMYGLNKYKVNNQNYIRDNCTEVTENYNFVDNFSLKSSSITGSCNKPPLGLFNNPKTRNSFQMCSDIEGIINNDDYIDSEQDDYNCGLNRNALVDEVSSSAATVYQGGPSSPPFLPVYTSTSVEVPSDLIVPATASVPDIGSSIYSKDNQHTCGELLLKSCFKSVENESDLQAVEADAVIKGQKVLTVLTDADGLKPTDTALKRSMKIDCTSSSKVVAAETSKFETSETGTWLSRCARVPLNWAQQTFFGFLALLTGKRNEQSKEQMKQGNSNNSQPTERIVRDDKAQLEYNLTLEDETYAPRKMSYLTGRSGYMYYKLLSMADVKYKLVRLQAEQNYLKHLYTWKLKTLAAVINVAKDYYSNPTEKNLQRWKLLKRNVSKEHQSYTDVALEVSQIPDYFPYFTISLILLQLLTLAVMCTRFGFSEPGMTLVSRKQSEVPTFLGTETIVSTEEANPWLGPPVQAFAAAGAVVASCMRPLKHLKTYTIKEGYRPMTETNRFYFGCCELGAPFNRAGTTTRNECEKMTFGSGKWTMGVLCSQRPFTKNSIAHVIRPCCTGREGACRMISHEHCIILEGVFHTDCDHCVQVNCLKDFCKLSSSSDDGATSLEDDVPWLPRSNTQWQWWRYLLAIPLTYGIMDCGIMICIALSLMKPLEMSVGWHRVIIIYINSALVGEMVSSRLEPFVPHVGSASGIAGIIGAAILDLFQAWHFQRFPLWEATKLIILIVYLLFLGTNYLFSFASVLTGVIAGSILSLVVIPYITYGGRLGYLRLRLVFFGCILIIFWFIFNHWLLELIETCDFCLYIECVAYSDNMCTLYPRIAREGDRAIV